MPHFHFHFPADHVPSAQRRDSLCVFALCMAAIFGAPAKCLAQDFAPSWTFNAGGGLAPALGAARNTLDTGWNFHAGLGFVLKPLPPPDNKTTLLLTANFMYDQLDVKPAALQEARILNPTNIGLLEADRKSVV